MSEITVNELAQWSQDPANCPAKYTASNLVQLINRGYLPESRREGAVRFVPAAEAKLILMSHKPGSHWIANRPRPGKRKANRLANVDQISTQAVESATSKTPSLAWADVV